MSPHISPYLSTSYGRDGTCFLGAFSKPFPQACTSSFPYLPPISPYLPPISPYLPPISLYLPPISPYLPPISPYLPAGVHELLGAINQRIVRAAMAALDGGDMAALGALMERHRARPRRVHDMSENWPQARSWTRRRSILTGWRRRSARRS